MLRKMLGDELGTADVTFELHWTDGAERAAVAGEFNGWSPEANPMDRDGDGTFRTTIRLELGHQYRFRYVLDGERWLNDWEADAYADNEFGGDDSVVTTDDIGE